MIYLFLGNKSVIINFKLFLIIILVGFLFSSATGQNIKISNVILKNQSIARHHKVEFEISIADATILNPYDYDEINVKGRFTSPTGAIKVVDGYFSEDFSLNDSNGNLTSLNTNGYRVRFSPDQAGEWKYIISVVSKYGNAQWQEGAFVCIPSASEGFIRSSPANYLHYDSGRQYIPIGYNIAWHNNNPVLNYKTWLTKLSAVGGNFYRLWMPHWALGIEWRNGNGFAGLRRYKESSMAYLDWLVSYSEDKNMGIMLCLQHHGQVSTTVNPNWSESPYNVANGGPCATTADFFTNQIAKNHTKNRLKYIIARWGYSTSIMSWELFNEINWTDNAVAIEPSVTTWHAEMAAYIKNTDPYRHLVTTSTASEDYGKAIWHNPDIDFTQSHIYINSENIERAIVSSSKKRLKEFEKPTLMGEFGLGDNANLANIDANGIHIHNTVWASLFSGAAGTAMSWWWDSYIEPRNLYYHFQPISKCASTIEFVKEDLQVAQATVQNAPGDLTFSTSLGWGEKAQTITIPVKVGSSYSNVPPFSTFLYGSQWNTQFKSPPTFETEHPQPVELIISTGSATGTMPVIAVYIDNVIVLNKPATINTKYSVTIPAGKHQIKIDNIGTDWITISSYTFTGLGTSIDVYTLKSRDNDYGCGWVFNNKYVHTNNSLPNIIKDAKIVATDYKDGMYDIRWYDCLEFEPILSSKGIAANGKLTFDVPDLAWDVVFTTSLNSDPTSTKELIARQFNIFLNPATSGRLVGISSVGILEQTVQATLFDMTGKPVHQFSLAFKNGFSTFQIPENLNSGVYWLHLKSEFQSFSKPFIIQN
jgi:hypothetical protein